MESKNFLMSHFKAQTGLVQFLLNFRRGAFSLFIPAWVPFPTLLEQESKIKVLSKIGYKILYIAWYKTLSLTVALWIVRGLGSFIENFLYPPHTQFPETNSSLSLKMLFSRLREKVITSGFLLLFFLNSLQLQIRKNGFS